LKAALIFINLAVNYKLDSYLRLVASSKGVHVILPKDNFYCAGVITHHDAIWGPVAGRIDHFINISLKGDGLTNLGGVDCSEGRMWKIASWCGHRSGRGSGGFSRRSAPGSRFCNSEAIGTLQS
jgi:hypothetical protein